MEVADRHWEHPMDFVSSKLHLNRSAVNETPVDSARLEPRSAPARYTPAVGGGCDMTIAEDPDQRLLERWRAVFENVPDVITEFDRDGRILITNSFPGQKLAEVIGRNIFDLSPEHLHDGLRRCIDEVFESGKPTAIESHVVTDRESWWITRFVPVRENGRVMSVLAIGTEFTARKRAENERERLIDELRDALEKVETLSGLLPICASCKNVRDDQGYWRRIEGYISERSGAEFSHGLCPACAKELHAQLDSLDAPKGKPHKNKD
jgi:PAS domain S-box-containing protein